MPPRATDRLLPGQTLLPGQKVFSAGGQYYLTLQTDGNLVLYSAANAALWSSDTVGKRNARAVMQTDGNFVMYDGGGAVWSSNSQGHPGAFVVVQDDGNLVVYQGSSPLWSSDSCRNCAPHKSWLSKAVSSTLHAPSNLAKAVAHEVSKVAPDAAKFFKDVTQSPYWKIGAGIAAIAIPGAGIAISAGMAAATSVGKAASLKDALIGAARDQIGQVVGPAATVGFDAANGVLLHGQKLDEAALGVVRQQLADAHPDAVAGFDSAVAMHVGRFSKFKAPKTMAEPAARAAFYTAQGLRGAPPALAKSVHTSLGVAKHPAMQKGFAVGIKAATREHKLEQAQIVLTRLRESMRAIRRQEPAAMKLLADTVARYKKGDPKAKAMLQMFAIADRANRELDGRRTAGALVQIGGLPMVTYLRTGAEYLATLATIPFGWVKETFFDDAASAA